MMAVYRFQSENSMVPGTRTAWVDVYPSDESVIFPDYQYGISCASDGNYYGWCRQGRYGETFYSDLHTESHEDIPITVFGIDY